MSTNIETKEILKYNENQVYNVKCIYIFFSILWIFIIFIFKLYASSGFFIIFIPFILFFIAFNNAESFTNEICNNTFQTTFIAIGLLLAIPMLSYIDKSHKSTHNLKELLILSMIFILSTYYHVWCSNNNLYIWKHCKSCLETISVTLFIYVLVTYYLMHKKF